jgi:hypothetical protein
VEVTQFTDGSVGVRHSKLGGEGAILFTRREWLAFVAGAKLNEFDPK